jgi:hypothetical protein
MPAVGLWLASDCAGGRTPALRSVAPPQRCALPHASIPHAAPPPKNTVPPQYKIMRAEWSYPRTVPELFATQLQVAGLTRGRTISHEDVKAVMAHFGVVHAVSIPRDQYR